MSRKPNITIDKLNEIFTVISELDSDKTDFKISKNEYEKIVGNTAYIKTLTGNRPSDTW